MIDLEAVLRWLLLLGLLATSVGWWRAELHNARLAELGHGFHDVAMECIDTSLVRLNALELGWRDLIGALSVGGPRAVVEIDRSIPAGPSIVPTPPTEESYDRVGGGVR